MSNIAEKTFEFHEDIRSAMVVDALGNVLSFASRTKAPVDPIYVKDVTSKWVALLGGMLRGSELTYGYLKWIHLRYLKLHLYGWLLDSGYLVFTSRSQLEDALLESIATNPSTRARYADKWKHEA